MSAHSVVCCSGWQKNTTDVHLYFSPRTLTSQFYVWVGISARLSCKVLQFDWLGWLGVSLVYISPYQDQRWLLWPIFRCHHFLKNLKQLGPTFHVSSLCVSMYLHTILKIMFERMYWIDFSLMSLINAHARLFFLRHLYNPARPYLNLHVY